MEEGFVTNPSW